MKKLLQFLLLSFGLLLLRYVFSLIIGYTFPTYTINSDVVVLNNSVQMSESPRVYRLSELWNKNQSVHFIDIIVNGYSRGDAAVGELENPALYPFYPMVVKIFTTIFPIFTGVESYYAIATFLSAVFFGLALFFLDKLLEMLWLQDDKKYFVFLLLLFFPSSFYFTMVYSEALFLFLSVVGLFFLFKKKYTVAFLILGLTILTRFIGVVYLVPFIFYFFMAERYNKKLAVLPKSVYYTAMAIFPTLLYYYHLFTKTGDFFSAFKAEGAVLDFMYLPLGYFFDYFQKFGLTFQPEYFLNFAILVVAIVILIYAFIRIFFVFEFRSLEQSALFIYFLVYVLLLSSMAATTDLFRYFGVCLPLYLLPAITSNTYVRSNKFLAILFVLLSIQTLFFVMFLMGVPAYV